MVFQLMNQNYGAANESLSWPGNKLSWIVTGM